MMEYLVRLGLPPGTATEDVYISIYAILAQCLFYKHYDSVVVMQFGKDQMQNEELQEKIFRNISAQVFSLLEYQSA